jgi:hypothetical protein
MASRLHECRASCGRAARPRAAERRERNRLVYIADKPAIPPLAALAAAAALIFFDLREIGQFGPDGVVFAFR